VTLRQTYTFAKLELSEAAYLEIFHKLVAAGYQHAFHPNEDSQHPLIDMHGIAVCPEVEMTEAKEPWGPQS
jgi:hypothetical protein